MKLKLLTFIIIISSILALFTVTAFAETKVVDISRPEGSEEIVTKDIFSICGTCIYDEATIELSYWNKTTEKYEPLENTDGQSVIKVGKIFGTDIKLNKGENQIRIKAYTKTIKDAQTKTYTITYTEKKNQESWWEKALNWFGGPDSKE